MARIGVVNFLNAWPLWAALEEKSGVTLVKDVPSALARALRAGDLDAALISSIEFFRLPAGYVHHPRLCIGADREVCSIRLFMHRGEGDFLSTLGSTGVIYTDMASRSSVAQLMLILRELKLDIPLREIADPDARIPSLKTGEALLSIGDTALKHRHRPSFDVQSEYHRLFGRGFVYALWVYPKGLQIEMEGLLDEVKARYDRDMVRYRDLAVARFRFPADFTNRYLTEVIQHQLTAERKADLEFFAQAMNAGA